MTFPRSGLRAGSIERASFLKSHLLGAKRALGHFDKPSEAHPMCGGAYNDLCLHRLGASHPLAGSRYSTFISHSSDLPYPLSHTTLSTSKPTPTSTTSTSIAMVSSSESDSLPPTPNVQPGVGLRAVMPRACEAGVRIFNEKNVTRFLEEWSMDCEDYGLDDEQRCCRLPLYYTPEINEIVHNLPGYSTKNWATLEANLKSYPLVHAEV